MFSEPPPYGSNPIASHPMTVQPKSASVPPTYNTVPAPHYVSPSYAPGPNQYPIHPSAPSPTQQDIPLVSNSNGNAGSPASNNSNGGGGITNVNNNTNNSNSNSTSNNNIIVNANVAAGASAGAAGLGTYTGNYLCLIGKDLLTRRQWNTGLFSCCYDFYGCINTTMCLPCVCISLANRLGECACVPCWPGALGTMRTKLRTMGGIRGSILRDCTVASCCCWCVVCQMKREMDDMKL